MPESFRFPESFLWGAATAGHQVEGHNVASDWWAFEEAGRLPFRSGEACRHLDLYARDFDLARSLGHNAHRFSVEWARIEPEPGSFDPAALAHYARVVEALRGRGLEPVLTLHHFVAPAWFTAQGGWLAPGGPERFAAYVERVVDRLGGEVRWWLTVNEPTVWAKHAYVNGDWPPCVEGAWGKSLRGMRAMARGHRLAYRIIHRRRPDAMVGMAHSAPHVMPADPDRPLDRWAARLRDLGLNRLPLALIGRPPDRWLDFIGVNYYNRSLVRWAPRGRAILLGEDDDRPRNGEVRRFSDTGWEIWPAGLAATLRAMAAHGLPLMVTENGIATTDENLRVEYLLSHLREVARVIAEGVPVAGYLHWSLIDNYEWTLGFAPRFGLCAVDRTTQARSPRPAAEVFAEICRSGRLPA